jgi:hypothetical protein
MIDQLRAASTLDELLSAVSAAVPEYVPQVCR